MDEGQPKPSMLSGDSRRQQEELAQAVDELLARDVHGAEEAAVLEEAHQVVNEALGGER